jgi:hypothetical protein
MVIHKDSSGLPAFEVLSERALDNDSYVYPSRLRRIAVIATYAFLCTVTLSLVIFLTSTSACLETHRCTTLDKAIELVLSVLWLVGLGGVTVLGWNGKLFGCKRSYRAPEA